MKCECGARTKVLETRDHGDNMMRRRVCLSCNVRFSTSERRVLANKPSPQPEPQNVAEARLRRNLRGVARRQSKETGEPLLELYAKWGVS